MENLETLLAVYRTKIVAYINNDSETKSKREYDRLLGFGEALKTLGWTEEKDRAFIKEIRKTL